MLIIEIDKVRANLRETSADKKFYLDMYQDHVYSKIKQDSAPEHCKNAAFCYLIGLNGGGNELRDTLTTGGGATHNNLKARTIRMLQHSMDIEVKIPNNKLNPTFA